MITREEALTLLEQSGTSESLMRHALASEAVMAAFAERIGADASLWGLTGLLHDLDYPQTEATPERHGLESAAMLEGRLPGEALQAIRSHNGEMNGCQPENVFDFALRASETVTGLIAAAALMRPTRYEGMSVKSIRKKMKDKAFAASVNRNNISQCQQAGLELEDFLSLAIGAMAARDGQ
ncbi:MAG: HDIG domain-containing protein [Desulfovibrio sp.]|nr:HDIG domain-containing protein [Desulfovibrio sp.]